MPSASPFTQDGGRPRRWSWRLGTVAGIDVFVHWTFALLLLYVFFASPGESEKAGSTLLEGIRNVAIVLAAFGCVLLHELGHALTARRFGIGTREIELYPIGGVAKLERIPQEPRQELVIAVAGPAVNFALAAAFAVPILLAAPGGFAGALLAILLWINLFMGGFNLLPAFPMDGGRVLRAFLASRLDYVSATFVAAGVGRLVAIVLGIAGLTAGWPGLVLIAVFVYVTGRAEAEMVRARAAEAAQQRSRARVSRAGLGDIEELLHGRLEEILEATRRQHARGRGAAPDEGPGGPDGERMPSGRTRPGEPVSGPVRDVPFTIEDP